MRRMNAPHGLTLVELMVAIALTLFMMALFITLVVQTSSGVRTMRGITAIDQKMRNAVNTLRQDLRHLYLKANNQDISPSRLFSAAGMIPDAGYFTIEENSPALPQGLDDWEQLVEIDTDDVLAFTIALSGTRIDDILHGRVTGDPNMPEYAIDPSTNQSIVYDLGQYLDDTYKEPRARYDLAANALLTVRNAEVVYFLRPVGRQYQPSDLGATGQRTTQPALFNLYRRQLLVLDDPDVNRGGRLAPYGIPVPNQGAYWPNAGFFDLYDISARVEYDDRYDANGDLNQFNDGTTWQWQDPVFSPLNPVFRIHFNSMADLARRENRFGMRLWQFQNSDPGAGTTQPQYVYRATSLSHVDSLNATPEFIHDCEPFDSNMAVPNGFAEPWFGRPIQQESNEAAYPFGFALPPQDNVSSPHILADADDNGFIDAYYTNPPTTSTRYGEDILLTNVVSFDIKVLEDGVEATNAYRVPNANVRRNQNLSNIGATKDMSTATAVSVAELRREFVDLGYLYDFPTLNPTDPNGNDQEPARDANCTVEANFVVAADAPFGVDLIPATPPVVFPPFGQSGQIGSITSGPTNHGLTNPRNTYDSWSSAYQYGFADTNADGVPDPPAPPNWRPVPYPRPVTAIQITLRVLEPKSAIVRTVTIRHYFEKRP